ncbi:MAG TPA: hypothetical protein VF326_10895 [Anaerolineaceae bacterium]
MAEFVWSCKLVKNGLLSTIQPRSHGAVMTGSINMPTGRGVDGGRVSYKQLDGMW